jgi:exonuclease III
VTANTAPRWREALAAAGLGHCAEPPRRLGVLTAAREPLRELSKPDGLPWPERVLCCALGERALVKDLGWVDAYRSLHGYGERSASWTYAHDRGGWRLDHVLLNALRPSAAAYAHDWRRAGLSDHSALVVEIRD